MAISRSDIYAKDERGGDWFQEFLCSLAGQSSNMQEILEAITGQHGKSVQSIVQQYRKDVGLDIVGGLEDEQVKEASVKNTEVKMSQASFRPLSIRHAQDHSSIIDMIEKDPKAVRDIESHCRGSGGFKSTISIINIIRKMFPDELISFTDKDLVAYIERIKDSHKAESGKVDIADVGAGTRIGDNNDDNAADYIRGAK
jgi:hypothetical protein